MRVVLIGGGKVGSFLARELHKAGRVVTVIEESQGHAEALAEESKVLVLEGDGTDINLLKAADAERADWILAVTGLDEVNLVACQLALTLGARQVLARLNNPLNRPTFEALDIPVVAVTDVMATLISREVEVPEFRHVALLGRGEVSVYEIDVPPDFEQRPVAELRLPPRSLFVTVVSGDEVRVPTAATIIRPGDQVTAVSSVDLEDEVRAVLGYRHGQTR
ncbi:MAG TPA: NAD-binding protein [Acidimicrobiia bacterium]|nr:NAD-binding protein [Acidimicrobiia bacterium]